MLKVRAANRNLSIEWEHVATTPNINGGTSCLIYDEDQPIYGDPVVVGESFLHPNDRFDKEIGRKVSLAKALGKLFPGDSGFASRKIVWEAYFARKGKTEIPPDERKAHYDKCREAVQTVIAKARRNPESDWTPWAQLAEIEFPNIGAAPSLPADCQCYKLSSPPPRVHDLWSALILIGAFALVTLLALAGSVISHSTCVTVVRTNASIETIRAVCK